MLKKINKTLNKNYFFRLFKRKIYEFYSNFLITDKLFLKRKFKKCIGRKLNLKNPSYYNDKIQWLKLYWRDNLASICADKYKVRDYVKEKIGEEYLNDLLSVYNKVDDIDFSLLPDKFVLKATHGSGFNLICKSKSELKWDIYQKEMKIWLKKDYASQNKEWVYNDIQPKLIVEKYLEDTESKSLNDYKVFCFNGDPKIIQVDIDRFGSHRRNFYDLDWNLVDGESAYPNDTNIKIVKPEKLNEIINLSKILSYGFPHVRVDFYILNDRVIFGEMTFFHQSGLSFMTPAKFEKQMGEWLKLPGKFRK
jgi:hypothetical protein